MTTIAPITDHFARAVKLFITQFREQKSFAKLIKPFMAEIQLLEDTAQDMFLKFGVTVAVGDQLDIIGNIVVESRAGKNDDDYRIAIYFKIWLNNSNAQPEVMIQALKFITQANRVRYNPIYPANMQLYTNGLILPYFLTNRMEEIAGAGIGLIPITVSESADIKNNEERKRYPFSLGGISKFDYPVLAFKDGSLLEFKDGSVLSFQLTPEEDLTESEGLGFAGVQIGGEVTTDGGHMCGVLQDGERFIFALLEFRDGSLLEFKDESVLELKYKIDYCKS